MDPREQEPDPFTPPERAAWECVVTAATRVLALPRQHPNEGWEVAEAFHEIQRYLMSRPIARDLERLSPGSMSLTDEARLALHPATGEEPGADAS